MPTPIKRRYADVVSELQTHVRSWKNTHRLTDTQVVAVLALIASDYAQAAYVVMSRDDAEADR
jgi:hypothetical protein